MSLPELVAQGLSDAQIAERLGVDPRTVLRRRQRAGLESRWTPPTPPHGTVARYKATTRRAGCRCTECRMAHSAAQETWRAAYQTKTTPTATRSRARWTPQDDATLLQLRSPLRAAAELGRTHSAVVKRLEHLRRTAVDAPTG